jgi:hypothetical protein
LDPRHRRHGSNVGPLRERPAQPGLEGSSASPLPWASTPEREALVDEGVGVFGRLYGRPVTREEARLAMERLIAFFDLLDQWDREKQARSGYEDHRAA